MTTSSHDDHVVRFADFDLAPSIQRGIDDLGFTQPTPIQEQTVPAALAGRDVMGLAQTGTGKTAAFGLPILARLNKQRRREPRALVVAPTRELAIQIDAELGRLAKHTGIKTATIFGGVSMNKQIQALRGRPDILVACPGRLLDLMNQGFVKLDAIEVLVLDEADHMFDMGFLPDIRRIIKALPEKRQNLLFSATMPKEVRGLAEDVLQAPAVVELAHAKPAQTIDHVLVPVHADKKMDHLRRLLDDDDFSSAIVFARTKHRAKRLALQLSRQGHRAVALQGNMSQGQRERAMNGFRGSQFDILVATDIVARGIDVPSVSHVINFDFPGTPEAYTHRIGRTGRAERSGKAFTLASGEDRASIRAVEKMLGATIPTYRLPGCDAPDPKPVDRDAAASRATRQQPARPRPPRQQQRRRQSNRNDASESRGGAPDGARRRRRRGGSSGRKAVSSPAPQ